MDAGIAAVLGAVAGGLIATGGTLGAAVLTGRHQERAQYGQWQRDGRLKAYGDLLQAVVTFHHEADIWVQKFRTKEDPGYVDETHINDVAPVIHLATVAEAKALLVMAQGPSEMADAARTLSGRCKEAARALETCVYGNDRMGPTQAYTCLRHLPEALDAFSDACSRALHAVR
ncbi:hypothetical protein ACWDV7_20515 [Streptomyces sp. NPDC003362]